MKSYGVTIQMKLFLVPFVFQYFLQNEMWDFWELKRSQMELRGFNTTNSVQAVLQTKTV